MMNASSVSFTTKPLLPPIYAFKLKQSAAISQNTTIHCRCFHFIYSKGAIQIKPQSWFQYRPPFMIPRKHHDSSTSVQAGWFLGLGDKKNVLPDIVNAGDPVLHEPAQEVRVEEIGAQKIQKIIDDMVMVMRKAPGVGLSAPQIGIPLRIIVLEDTKEYISYAPKKDIEAQQRKPFDLLVVINPELRKKGDRTALFFEGCLSVDGFRAVVERHLEVEVNGFDRNGEEIKIEASGWQARILQHECDHLDGTIYVDKMKPRTFRTADNLGLPLANGCPKLGIR